MGEYLKIINLKSVDSTNNYAFKLAEKGEREITVVKADVQTQGRGRKNKSWFSPKDKGIYASFILRPSNSPQKTVLLPLIFSLGVSKVLSDIVEAKIKWPNDVMVGDKKIAGILAEARGDKQRIEFVVVGCGVNINAKKEDIPSSATSLYLETTNTYNLEELFKKFIKEIISLYKEFKKDNIEFLLGEISNYQEKDYFKERNYLVNQRIRELVQFRR